MADKQLIARSTIQSTSSTSSSACSRVYSHRIYMFCFLWAEICSFAAKWLAANEMKTASTLHRDRLPPRWIANSQAERESRSHVWTFQRKKRALFCYCVHFEKRKIESSRNGKQSRIVESKIFKSSVNNIIMKLNYYPNLPSTTLLKMCDYKFVQWRTFGLSINK